MTDKAKQGKTAKRNGKEFEKLLDNYFLYLKKIKVCVIEKTPEPFRYIKPLNANSYGMFIATFTKPAQPDFKGTLAGGRAIVLEAKSVASDRINLSVLTKQEKEDLILYSQLGAISGVIVKSQQLNNIYFFPTDFFCNIYELTGYKHIEFENAKGFILKGIEENKINAINKIVELNCMSNSDLLKIKCY